MKINDIIESSQAEFVDPEHSAQRHSLFIRFLILLGCTVLFLSMFFPTAYQGPRALVLLLIFTVVCVTILITGRTGLTRQIVILNVFFVTLGAAYVFYGLVRGAPGAHRVATVHVIWPMVYTLLISGMRSELAFRLVAKTTVLAAIAISLYAVSFLFAFVGILPASLYIEFDVGQAIGLYDGYVEFTMYSVSSMLFIIPFLFCCLIIWPRENSPVSRLVLWGTFFLSICFAVLTGRRAMWLICAAAPLIVVFGAYFLSSSFRQKHRRVILNRVMSLMGLGVVAAVSLGLLFGIEMALLADYFWEALDIFTGAGGGSQYIRYEQFVALTESWQYSPMFGWGLGEEVPGVIRSNEQAWAFELSYLGILHQTGLFGFACYGVGILWIYFMAARIIRSDHWMALYIYPTVVGMTTFLIANATNPYLAKFDFMWVIFLPIAMINYWLIDSSVPDQKVQPKRANLIAV